MCMYVQQIALGVVAVLGGLVLWKVIKNDDSVSALLVVMWLHGQCAACFIQAVILCQHLCLQCCVGFI